ncbi:MAG TPA: SBBP repeat-containing protein [Xenococcaceae cyanobacterium]
MDEFEVFASLLTPASDLVRGEITPAEASFGRAGNDYLQTYIPQASNLQSQNVDFLFGDLFDNTEEELAIAFAIQDGTNPLGILDTGPPSIGADTFVLGDTNGAYYNDREFTGSELLDPTNLFGLNDYSLIYDFNPAQDTIQLSGSPKDYLLVELNGLQVESVSQPFFGEAVFLREKNRIDLVTYIISTPEVEINLNESYFDYVDKAPKETIKDIGQIGTPGIDVSTGTATDSQGNVYVTGYTSGSLAGSRGNLDVWVAKYDREGKEQWTRQFGSDASDEVYGIVTDNDGNFYLSGTTEGNLFTAPQSEAKDAWVAKFNSNGNLIWSQQYGTSLTNAFSTNSFDVDIDAENNVYVSGLGIKDNPDRETFNFTVEDDSFVIKYDSDGNQQWFTAIDNPFFVESYGVDVAPDGTVYATGWTQGLTQESDPVRPNILKYDYWFAQLSNDGVIQNIQQFNSSDQGLEFAWDIQTDSEGSAYITGWTTGNLEGSSGSYDPWLAKYNPDGSQAWRRQFGTSGDDGSYLASLDIDSSNNIYLTGYTNSNLGGLNAGSFDAWVAKYDSAGLLQWTQQLGSGDLDFGTDVAVNDFGELFVTGFTAGSLGKRSEGAIDAWVAKLDANSGEIEKFKDDIKGSKGKRGKEEPVEIDFDDDDQLSEQEIVEELNEVFEPNASNGFTNFFAQALVENSVQLEFEDATGDELDDIDRDEIEGVGRGRGNGGGNGNGRDDDDDDGRGNGRGNGRDDDDDDDD